MVGGAGRALALILHPRLDRAILKPEYLGREMIKSVTPSLTNQMVMCLIKLVILSRKYLPRNLEDTDYHATSINAFSIVLNTT